MSDEIQIMFLEQAEPLANIYGSISTYIYVRFIYMYYTISETINCFFVMKVNPHYKEHCL